jgi:3-phosphoglycerate kinase
MEKMFPRTVVDGVSLSRMIIGTNWILGYSHTSPAADNLIRSKHNSVEPIVDMLEVFLNRGVDTMMAPFAGNQTLQDAVKLAEDRTGKGLILIDTPIINVDDNANARKEAEAVIESSRKLGATFCLPHHSSVEQLVNKNKQTIDRLPDYLGMIRDHGMKPGLSCHMPELIIYSDLNDYDVQTYIQIYNCMGFLMQVEVEYIHKVIHNAKKPVMTIKPMAAGRVSPFVGLTFSWHTIRPCDMVTVGCLTPEEADEDIEISMAAFERRPPVLEGRNSPNKTKIML